MVYFISETYIRENTVFNQNLDIKDIWTFGKFGSLFNTDLICSSMNIPTPKDNMNGSMVYEKFYNKEIEEIINYCNKDVESLINLIKKFKDFE